MKIGRCRLLIINIIIIIGILETTLAQRRNGPQNFNNNNNNYFRQNNNNQQWRLGNRRQNNMATNPTRRSRNPRLNGLLNTRLRQSNAAPAMNVLGGTEQQARNTLSPLQATANNNRFSNQQGNLNLLRNRGMNQLRNTNQRTGTLNNNNMRPLLRSSLNRNLNLRTTSLPNVNQIQPTRTLAQNDLLQRNPRLLGQNRNMINSLNGNRNSRNNGLQSNNMNNLRQIGNNALNRQLNQQQNLNSINKQQGVNALNHQQDLNALKQQQGLNSVNQQQGLNVLNQQKDLNGMNQQQGLNALNQQQNLNALKQQQGLNSVNQQQGLNVLNQQKDINALNQQQGVNGMNQQQGPNGMNQQQGINSLNQQQNLNGINQQQQNLNALKQQQDLNALNQQQGLNGMNQQQGLNALNQQQGLNNINQQTGLNGMNQQQGVNALNQQQGVNALNQQQVLDDVNQQQGLNALNQQQGPNALNQQQGLNGVNQQQSLNALNQQQGLNSLNQQQSLNALNQQQGLNGVNQQQSINALNQQQGLNGVNQQQGLNDVNQQQGLNALNQQQGLNGMNRQQQNLNGMNQQQGLNGVNQHQGLNGVNQQQGLSGMNQQEGTTNGINQQQGFNGMNQQQGLNGMNQQQGLNGMLQLQDPNGINEQQQGPNFMDQQQIFKSGVHQQGFNGMNQQQGLKQQQSLNSMNRQQQLNNMNQQQGLNGMIQQQNPNIMNQQQGLNALNQQQGLEGINQQQVLMGMNQQHDLNGINQQQGFNGMNQHQGLNAVNQQQSLNGISQQQNLNDANKQQSINSVNQQQDKNGLNKQQQGPNNMNLQQGLNGVNQQQGLDVMIQNQDPNGFNQQQQNLNGMSQRQGLNDVNQQQNLNGNNQQQGLNDVNQQQGLNSMNQQQGLNGMNQQQGLNDVNQQKGLNDVNQQQGLNGMNQQQGLNSVSQIQRIVEATVEQTASNGQQGLKQQMEQFKSNNGPQTFQDPQTAGDMTREFPIARSRYPLETSIQFDIQNQNLQKPSNAQLAGSSTGNQMEEQLRAKDRPTLLLDSQPATSVNVQGNIDNRVAPTNQPNDALNKFDSTSSRTDASISSSVPSSRIDSLQVDNTRGVKDSISFTDSIGSSSSIVEPVLPVDTAPQMSNPSQTTNLVEQASNVQNTGARSNNVVEQIQPVSVTANATLESKTPVQDSKSAPIEITVIDPRRFDRFPNRADPNGRYQEMYMPVRNGPREFSPYVHAPYYHGPEMTEYGMMSRFEFYHPGGRNPPNNVTSKDATAVKKNIVQVQGSQPILDNVRRDRPLDTTAPKQSTLPVDTPKLLNPERPTFDHRSAEARSQNGYIEINSKTDFRSSSNTNRNDLPGGPQRKVFIKYATQEKIPEQHSVNIGAKSKVVEAKQPVVEVHQHERRRPVVEPVMDSRAQHESYPSQWRTADASNNQMGIAPANPNQASNNDLQTATGSRQLNPVASGSPPAYREVLPERLNFPSSRERVQYPELKKELPKDLLVESAMKNQPSVPKLMASGYPERPHVNEWQSREIFHSRQSSSNERLPKMNPAPAQVVRLPNVPTTSAPFVEIVTKTAWTPEPPKSVQQNMFPQRPRNNQPPHQPWNHYDHQMHNTGTVSATGIKLPNRDMQTTAVPYDLFMATTAKPTPQTFPQPVIPNINVSKDLSNPPTVPDVKLPGYAEGGYIDAFGRFYPYQKQEVAAPKSVKSPTASVAQLKTQTGPGQTLPKIQKVPKTQPSTTSKPVVTTKAPEPIPAKKEIPPKVHKSRDAGHQNGGPSHHNGGMNNHHRDRFHHNAGRGHQNMGPPHDQHNYHGSGPSHGPANQPQYPMQGGHGPPGYYPPPQGQYQPYDQPPRYDYPPPTDRNMHNQQPYDPEMNHQGPHGMPPQGSNNQPDPYADPYGQGMPPHNSYNQQQGGYNQQYSPYGPPVDQYQNPPYHYQGGSQFADPHFLGIGRWDRTMPRSSRKRARTSNKAVRPPNGGMRGRAPPARPPMHGMMPPRNSPPLPGSPGFMQWMRRMDSMGIDTMFEMPDSTDPTLPPPTMPPPTHRPAVFQGVPAGYVPPSVVKAASIPVVKEVILPGSFNLLSTVPPPQLQSQFNAGVKTSTISPIVISSNNSSQAILKKASLKELLLTMTKWALQASDKLTQSPIWIPPPTTPTTPAPTTTTPTTPAPTTTTTSVPTTQTTMAIPKPVKSKASSLSMLASPDVLHKYFRHDRLPLVMNKFTPPPTVPITTRRLTTGARTTRVILLDVNKPVLRAQQSSQHQQGSHQGHVLRHNQHHDGHHMQPPQNFNGPQSSQHNHGSHGFEHNQHQGSYQMANSQIHQGLPSSQHHQGLKHHQNSESHHMNQHGSQYGPPSSQHHQGSRPPHGLKNHESHHKKSSQIQQGPPSFQHHQGIPPSQGLNHQKHQESHHMKRPEGPQGLAYDHYREGQHMNQPERIPYQPGQTIPQSHNGMRPVDRPKDPFSHSANGQNMHISGNYQHPTDTNMLNNPHPQQDIPANQHHVPNQYAVNSNGQYNHHSGRDQASSMPFQGPQGTLNVGANNPGEPIHISAIKNEPHVNSNHHPHNNNQAPNVPYDVQQSKHASPVKQQFEPHLHAVNSNGPVMGNSNHVQEYNGNPSHSAPFGSQPEPLGKYPSVQNKNAPHTTGSNVHDLSHQAPNTPYAIEARNQPKALTQNIVDGFKYIDIPLDGKMDINSLLKKLMAMNKPPAADQSNIEFSTRSKVYQHPSSNDLPIDPVNAPAASNGPQPIQQDIKINSAQDISVAQPKQEQPQINPGFNSREAQPVNHTIPKPSNETNVNPRLAVHFEHHRGPRYNPYYHSQNHYDATVNSQGAPSAKHNQNQYDPKMNTHDMSSMGQAASTGNEYHPGQYQYPNVPDPRALDTPGHVDLQHTHEVNNTALPIQKHPIDSSTNTNPGAPPNDLPLTTNVELSPKSNGQNLQESNPNKLMSQGQGQYQPRPSNSGVPVNDQPMPLNVHIHPEQTNPNPQDISVGPTDRHPSGQYPPEHFGPRNPHVQSGVPNVQENTTKPVPSMEPPVDHQSKGHELHFDSRGRPNYDQNNPHHRANGYPNWQRPHPQELPPNVQLKPAFFSYPHESYHKPSGSNQHETYPQNSGAAPHHNERAYRHPNGPSAQTPYNKPSGANHQDGAYQQPIGPNTHEPYPQPSGAEINGPNSHQQYPKPQGAVFTPINQEGGAYPQPNGPNPHEPYPQHSGANHQGATSQQINGPNPDEPYPQHSVANHQGGPSQQINGPNPQEPYPHNSGANHQGGPYQQHNGPNPQEPYPQHPGANHQGGPSQQINGPNPQEPYPQHPGANHQGGPSQQINGPNPQEPYPQHPGANHQGGPSQQINGPNPQEPYPHNSGANHQGGPSQQINGPNPQEPFPHNSGANHQGGPSKQINGPNPHEPYPQHSGADHQGGPSKQINEPNPQEQYPHNSGANHQGGPSQPINGPNSHKTYPQLSGSAVNNHEGAAANQQGVYLEPNVPNSHQPSGAYQHPNGPHPHQTYPQPSGAALSHQEGAYPQPNGPNQHQPDQTNGQHPQQTYPKPSGAEANQPETGYPQPNGLSPQEQYSHPSGTAVNHPEGAYSQTNGQNSHEPYPQPSGAATNHHGRAFPQGPHESFSGHPHHGPPPHYYSEHQYHPRAHEGNQNGAFPQAEFQRPQFISGPHFRPEFHPPGPHNPESGPRYNHHDIGHPETTTHAESTTTPIPVTTTTPTIQSTPKTASKNNGPASIADINKRIAELMVQINRLNKAPDAAAPLDSVASIALHPAGMDVPLLHRAPAQSTNLIHQDHVQAEQPNFEEIIRDINSHRQENGLGSGDVNKMGEHIILENSEGLNTAGESHTASNLPVEQTGLHQTHNVLKGMVQRHPGNLLNTTPQPTQPNYATVHSQPDPHVVVWNGAQNQAVPNSKKLKALKRELASHTKLLWDMYQKTNSEVLKKAEVLNHDSTLLTRPYTVLEQGKIKSMNSAVLNDHMIKLLKNQAKQDSKSASTKTHAQNTKAVATSGVTVQPAKNVLIKIPKLSNPSASSLIHKILQHGHYNVDTSSVVANSSEAAPYQIHVPQPPPGTPIQNVFQIIIPGSEIVVSTESPPEVLTTTEEPPTTTTPEVTTIVDLEAAGEQGMKNGNSDFYNYYYYEDD